MMISNKFRRNVHLTKTRNNDRIVDQKMRIRKGERAWVP
jgi:hypothetical protein